MLFKKIFVKAAGKKWGTETLMDPSANGTEAFRTDGHTYGVYHMVWTMYAYECSENRWKKCRHSCVHLRLIGQWSLCVSA